MSNKEKTSAALKNVEFEIKSVDGVVKKINLTPLRRKEAAEVFHNTLSAVLKAIAKGGDSRDDAILEAVKALDFDTFWRLAKKILRFAQITDEEKGIVDIEDLDKTNYFEDNPEELYLIVFKGIMENYPKFFLKIKQKMGKDLDLTDLVK